MLDVLRRQGIDPAEMGRVLKSRIPSLVSMKLNIREAAVQVVAERILELAPTVRPRVMKPAPASQAERVAAVGIERADAIKYAQRLVDA